MLVYGVFALLIGQQLAYQALGYPSSDGAAGQAFLRQQVPRGVNDANATAMTGANRPSARLISLTLTSSPYFKSSSRYNTSYMLSALGQLITKDISYAWNDKPPAPTEQAPIPVPPGDPMFAAFNQQQQPLKQGSRSVLQFERTQTVRSSSGQLEPVNRASSFVDASVLYGQNATWNHAVRAGTAGRLLDDGHRMLPFNYDSTSGEAILPMGNLAKIIPDSELRLGGHPQVNQNAFPLVLTSLLLREHNRRAQQIEMAHSDWSDEQIYQEARKWVIAHMQRITFVDYMNELGIPLPPFAGYKSATNPSVDVFFSTAAFRYGHATLTDVLLRLDDDWSEHQHGHLALMQTYYNPNVVLSAGIEPVIRGFIALPQGDVEPRWSSSVSGNLWGYSPHNGTDLVALNIQRGRDHRIPDYNTCRRALGLKPIGTFSELTPDPQLAASLQSLYKDINNIDAYVGGLAEPHHMQSHMGELFTTSLKDQFTRLRDGDWWYYENTANGLFNASDIQEIQQTSMRDLILRNTNITNLPDNIFSAAAAGSCSAAAAGSSAAAPQQLRLPNLLNGNAQMEVRKSDTDGWVRVSVTATGDGWVGFGVAKPDAAFPMIGADMVVGRMVDGSPQVNRYTATAHAPPVQAADAGQLKVIRFEQANGQQTLEFERPLAASANAASDGSVSMPLDSPVTLLIARGPGSDITSMTAYHGPQNREHRTVSKLFSGSDITNGDANAAGNAGVTKRKAHGILMALNFIIVMPLGALAARQLRCHWLRKSGFRASLFYVHIATQVSGVVIATVGFVLATRFFGTNYKQVAWHHGQVGVAILVLVYSQLLMGFVRPAASSAASYRRQFWDYSHTLVGRAAMMLGVMNVIVGIFIFTTSFGGNLALWGGLCAAGLAAIQLIQYTLDRHEKTAVLKLELDRLQRQITLNLDKDVDDMDPSEDFDKDPGAPLGKDISDDTLATLPDNDPMMRTFPVGSGGIAAPGRTQFAGLGPAHGNVVAARMGGLDGLNPASVQGPGFPEALPPYGVRGADVNIPDKDYSFTKHQGEGFMGRLTEGILKKHDQSVNGGSSGSAAGGVAGAGGIYGQP